MNKESISYTFRDYANAEQARSSVVGLIESDRFIHDPRLFLASVSRSNYPLMLTNFTVEDFEQMRLFQVEGHDIGFALQQNGSEYYDDIVAVHNSDPVVRLIGKFLLEAAIRNGGRKLDHFGTTMLNDLYESVGLIEVRREKFNPEFDPGGVFESTYGRLPVIHRELLT